MIRCCRRALRAALVSGSVIGCLAALLPQAVYAAGKNGAQPIGSGPPAPAGGPIFPMSNEGVDILHLFLVILAESAVVFALVVLALLINIFRYSHKPGFDEEPKQVYGNRRIEMAWTAIPAAILLVAFILTVIVMNQVNNPVHAAGGMVKVEAIGHQWWWEFRIPKYHVVTANELHIPTNTTVAVEMTSVDVIHSFWVPQLSRQMDATPNNHTYVYINTSHPGTYAGACYEYCGLDHAWMQFRVVVQRPAQFVAWARHEASPGNTPTSALATDGETIFFARSCAACHTVNGTPAAGTAGPNLSHVGSRWGIAGGVLPMSQQNLARWVGNPNAYKPGALMPSFPLSKHDLDAVAAYLYGLK